MNWYKGNIAEAVEESKSKNAIFVVYVEGKDENTKKLTDILNEKKIRTKLETDNFVAIKIESGSQSYLQFASIYQVVPVPSLFFIGKSGTPIEIATGVIASVKELEDKIDKVLTIAEKSVPKSFKESESAPTSSTQLNKDAAPATSSSQMKKDEVICEGNVCYKKSSKPENDKSESDSENEENLPAAARLLLARQRECYEREKKEEKEQELRRRREGKQIQNLQNWQKEHELKEVQENLRRDRIEEQSARERILAQIAGDRAERAKKFNIETQQVGTSKKAADTPQCTSNSNMARIQFRFPDGNHKNHSFDCQDKFIVVRNHVKTVLLPGTGLKDFILATTYPKRELTTENDHLTLTELELFPSAVILIINKDNFKHSSLTNPNGNIFTMLFWVLFSPVVAVYNFFKNLGPRFTQNANVYVAQDANPAPNNANSEENKTHSDVAKLRRNMDRFLPQSESSVNTSSSSGNSSQKGNRAFGNPNIHSLNDNRKDSDDENATWNGNSTQQQ